MWESVSTTSAGVRRDALGARTRAILVVAALALPWTVSQASAEMPSLTLAVGVGGVSPEGMHLVVTGDAPLASPRVRVEPGAVRVWFFGTKPMYPASVDGVGGLLKRAEMRTGYRSSTVVTIALAYPANWLGDEHVRILQAPQRIELWLPAAPTSMPPAAFARDALSEPALEPNPQEAAVSEPSMVPAQDRTAPFAWLGESVSWAALAALGALGLALTWLLRRVGARWRRQRRPLRAMGVVDSHPLGNGERLVLVRALDTAHLLLVHGGRAEYCGPIVGGASLRDDRYSVPAHALASALGRDAALWPPEAAPQAHATVSPEGAGVQRPSQPPPLPQPAAMDPANPDPGVHRRDTRPAPPMTAPRDAMRPVEDRTTGVRPSLGRDPMSRPLMEQPTRVPRPRHLSGVTPSYLSDADIEPIDDSLGSRIARRR